MTCIFLGKMQASSKTAGNTLLWPRATLAIMKAGGFAAVFGGRVPHGSKAAQNIHFGKNCINMRKKVYPKAKLQRLRLQAAELMLWGSLALSLMVLCGILHLIEGEAVLTAAEAAYYGAMLEYPVAALAIATVTTLLLSYAAKRGT